MKKTIVLAMIVFLAACAPWTRVGGVHNVSSKNFQVDLPDGWMMETMAPSLVITRDGRPLQQVIVERSSVEDELGNTKKKFDKKMLPQEVAAVVQDNVSSDPAVSNFELIEDSPAVIGRQPGFKLVFSYKNKDGLKKKSVYYGFIWREWFYGIRYDAASRHYFDKDSDVFETIVKSFRLIKAE